ncbi:MAG: single-stranded DNA-binding protein [Thermoplasmata archaeon]|nr:single-stranded DNA-binding protein [Thermoplasmata archaeon]
MDMNELTPHLEELKRVLNGKVSEEELLRELDIYLNKYRTDITSAKRGILKKHGAATPTQSSFVTAASVSKKISALSGSEQNVDILAKVVFSDKKQVTIKGAPRVIVSGILGDETGTASFTVWDGENCELEKGAVYLFKNAYTKLWNDKIQINLGNRSVISRENVELAMPERQISYSSSVAKISDLREGIGNVTISGKIVSIESRNTVVRGEEKTVFSGIIADETGKVQFSAWTDFGLSEGDCVCIKNGYIRAWKGIPQLNFGDKSEVSKVDDTFGNVEGTSATKKTVSEIVKNGGGLDNAVSGMVVELRTGSGLIKRCPQCNRSILGTDCLTHGHVEPVMDLRMKVIVDDGTGAINAIIGRELTEKLTSITLSMATELAKARGDSEIIAKSIAERIMLKHITITGNAMNDEYGPMMIVKDAEIDEIDVIAEAESLLAKVEEVLM